MMRSGVLLATLVLTGCPLLPAPPGSEQLGTYSISAEPVLSDGGADSLRPDGGAWCPLVDVSPTAFRFDAIVTREPGTGQAWMTLGGGYPRDAGWDGQVLESVAAVRRLFPSCAACPETIATETVRVALLSKSQSDAVGGRCPPHPLDGGVPTPGGAILGPGQSAAGFDALYACGTMEFAVTLSAPAAPESGCAVGCDDCIVRYVLQGERR